MFERFTKSAIKVIMSAQDEARRSGHNCIGIDFIFLGLIAESKGIAAQILSQHGITLTNARIEIDKILGKGTDLVAEEIPFTQRAKIVLEYSLSVANQLDDEFVDTEHLLIGIIKEQEVISTILENLSVEPSDLANSVAIYLQQRESNSSTRQVYVLMFNVGTDNELIHSISSNGKETILLFESPEEASNFAQQLKEQKFPVPNLEAMEIGIVVSFCHSSGYDWKFLPSGTNLKPVPNEPTQQDLSLQFLMKVLQTTVESKGEGQLFYPWLANNTDKLDGMLADILRRWGKNALREADVDEAQSHAAVIIIFSNLIQQFPLGDPASNQEIAIAGYEVVLTIFTEQVFPQEWAKIQNNLGVAYWNRIRGDKSENIETAIAYYNAALIVYTEAAYPVDWAMVQNNLGLVYIDRIRESKRESIETAIGYFQAALNVYTEANYPQTWAQIQNHLGTAYRNRIKENKANNLETAIAHHHAALRIATEKQFPQDFAMAQINLGGAYSERIKGDIAENLENALKCFRSALDFYDKYSFPLQWALIQNNLGALYRLRTQGDKVENLENAIACSQAALEVYTEFDFPNDWAVAKNTLGMAYIDRIQGDRSQNIESAIIHLNEALRVHTKTAHPEDWAMIQTNLGIAYQYRIQDKKAENLKKAIVYCQAAITVFTEDEFPDRWAINQNNMGNNYFRLGEKDENQIELAIACFHAALRVRTEQDFPVEWAKLQSNLGNAYRDRIQDDRSENIETAITAHQSAAKVFNKSLPLEWAANQSNLGIDYSIRIRGDEVENRNFAIKCYQEALEIRRDIVPQDYLQTALALGLAYELTRNLQEAYSTFKTAIDIAEELREEIVSGNDAKQKLAEQWHILYREMVEVCLELGKYPEALEYAERSKTRNLVELILNQDSNTIFQTDAEQLALLHNEIATGQAKIQNGTAENPKAFGQHLQKLRQQRNELQDKYLPVGYGFKLDQFQATLDEQTAVVEWYLTGTSLEAFIITRNNVALCNVERRLKISPPSDNLKTLIKWNNEYRQVYENNKSEWIDSLGSRLERLAEILEIDTIIKLIPKYCSRLVLIPHRYLHLFPLHALPLASGELLYEKFSNGVSYAPSCQILQQVQKRERPEFQSLFAIQNPTEDLNYADLEVQIIQSYFNNPTVLKKTAATLTAINNTDLNAHHCIHFSCHGYFNLTSPGKSALILANARVTDVPIELDPDRYLILKSGKILDLDKCLTLDKTFAIKLEKSRLVTLSACETGLIDFNNISDEYIGLPSGFLLAGSQAVVSSLWTVDDFSTSFLMMKFYEQMQTINNVYLALNQAQQWLQTLTGDEFKALLDRYDPQIKFFLAQLPEEYRPLEKAKLKKISERNYPFGKPFYWAGFIATGI